MEHAIPSPQPRDAAADNRAENDPAETVRPAGNLFVELTKARLSGLVVVTTAFGYLVALGGRPIDWGVIALTALGTTLAAFGASVLNQVVEVPRDVRMNRTRNRPIPSGRIGRGTATALGVVLGVGGPALLWATVNWITAALALATLLIYVAIYTPMKPVSTLNTVVGAVCGALPPMIGWAAATGSIEIGAVLIGLLLFLWQMPHFFALAWLYRDDYERGGFRMLPVVDGDGRVTFNVMVLYAAALVVLGPVMTLQSLSGWWFATESAVLGLIFLALCIQLRNEPTRANARTVFLASLIYLPAVLGLMLLDRGNAPTATSLLTDRTQRAIEAWEHAHPLPGPSK